MDLEAKVNLILAKMETIPFTEIGDELRDTLASVKVAAGQLDKEVLPEARKTMEDLQRAAAAAEKVLKSSDRNLVGTDAPAQQELREALQEIARAARAVGVLAEYLEQNPGALIQGKSREKP